MKSAAFLVTMLGVALLGCATNSKHSNSGMVKVHEEPQSLRIVLVHADGTTQDVGEHLMSAEAIAATDGTSIAGISMEANGAWVGVDLHLNGPVDGMNSEPGEHSCLEIFTDLAGSVIRIVPLPSESAPPLCTPVYTIEGTTIKVKCKSLDCPTTNTCTLHREDLPHEIRYWCTCDAAP